jgi:CheY-like chemotaxis protein
LQLFITYVKKRHSDFFSMSPSRILSISYDPTLLSTRQQLLEHRGYTVVSAEGLVQAVQKFHDGEYDLVVMGHSIPHSDKEELLKVIKRQCPVPVIELTRGGEPPLEGVAASADPMQPKIFMDLVDKFLREDSSARA